MLQELLKEIAPVSLHILFETDVIQPKKKKPALTQGTTQRRVTGTRFQTKSYVL